MIVGSGLIANAFKQATFTHENLIIFAAGVSNSREERDQEYQRELNLLKDITSKHKDKRLVYFSSCNIESNQKSTYLRCKKEVESYVENTVENYLILRLPNVVGLSENRNQLVNYFFYSLMEQREITVQVDCVRHLLDVEDLPKLVEVLTKLPLESKVLNVAFNNGIKVKDIVTVLEKVVGKKFKNPVEVSNGNDYVIDNRDFISYINDLDWFNTDPKSIIEKYFSKRN